MQEFILPENLTVPKIQQGVLSDYKITLFYGWRDGGKSTSCLRILILKCLFDLNFRWAHVRQHYNELQGTSFQAIQDEIKAMGLERYFSWTEKNFKIVNKLRPSNYFFGASGDKPDKIRSTPNVTGIYWDEFHDVTAETFGSVMGTIRENLQNKAQTKFIALFNNDKVPADGFIAKTFFDPLSPIYNDVERILIQHTNNPFIDQEQTKKKLLLTVLGDVEKYDLLTSGQFQEEQVDKPFIIADTTNLFNPQLRYDPRQPLLLSWDINNEPLTCLVSNVHIGKHNHDIGMIRTFDEIKIGQDEILKYPNLDKYMIACKIIRERYPNAIFYITGDASGWQGDPMFKGSITSMYLYVCSMLGLNPKSAIITPKRNIEHLTSQTLCNSAIINHPDIQINPNTCPILAKEITKSRMEEKGKNILKDRKEHKNDSLDAWRYILQTLLYPYWLTLNSNNNE